MRVLPRIIRHIEYFARPEAPPADENAQFHGPSLPKTGQADIHVRRSQSVRIMLTEAWGCRGCGNGADGICGVCACCGAGYRATPTTAIYVLSAGTTRNDAADHLQSRATQGEMAILF